MDGVVHPVPTLAEQLAALVTSPGTVTDYVWDTSEALHSWGLNEVVLRAERAYSGCLYIFKCIVFIFMFSACIRDWRHVADLIDGLVRLEEECQAELSSMDDGRAASGISLRQLTILSSGIRSELRSRRSDRRVLMENCRRLYWQSRWVVEKRYGNFNFLFYPGLFKDPLPFIG